MGIGEIAARAVFLDRDGVINANVYNPANGEYESPHRPEDFRVVDGALPAIARLRDAGFHLFLVSNQPSYAKGKTTLAQIEATHERLVEALNQAGISFSAFYYCYHHPQGVVAAYSGPCQCRKPSPFFLLKARDNFGLRLDESWMIGDRATDIECGRAAGVRTIRVAADHPARRSPNETAADFEAQDLRRATEIVLRHHRA
jgi:D-glycero-D-manno-heptose 1,7-bisphosphate phosphatase